VLGAAIEVVGTPTSIDAATSRRLPDPTMAHEEVSNSSMTADTSTSKEIHHVTSSLSTMPRTASSIRDVTGPSSERSRYAPPSYPPPKTAPPPLAIATSSSASSMPLLGQALAKGIAAKTAAHTSGVKQRSQIFDEMHAFMVLFGWKKCIYCWLSGESPRPHYSDGCPLMQTWLRMDEDNSRSYIRQFSANFPFPNNNDGPGERVYVCPGCALPQNSLFHNEAKGKGRYKCLFDGMVNRLACALCSHAPWKQIAVDRSDGRLNATSPPLMIAQWLSNWESIPRSNLFAIFQVMANESMHGKYY
jgi:hypothetical protein